MKKPENFYKNGKDDNTKVSEMKTKKYDIEKTRYK